MRHRPILPALAALVLSLGCGSEESAPTAAPDPAPEATTAPDPAPAAAPEVAPVLEGELEVGDGNPDAICLPEIDRALEVDRQFCVAAEAERAMLCRMGPLMADVADRRLYRSLGLRGLDAYAHERLGMSPRKARALLRVERACRRPATLRTGWASGRIGWSQAQALVAVPSEHHEAWIARAERTTVRRLQDDVEWAVAHENFDVAALPDLADAVLPTCAERRARKRLSLPAHSLQKRDPVTPPLP